MYVSDEEEPTDTAYALGEDLDESDLELDDDSDLVQLIDLSLFHSSSQRYSIVGSLTS